MMKFQKQIPGCHRAKRGVRLGKGGATWGTSWWWNFSKTSIGTILTLRRKGWSVWFLISINLQLSPNKKSNFQKFNRIYFKSFLIWNNYGFQEPFLHYTFVSNLKIKLSELRLNWQTCGRHRTSTLDQNIPPHQTNWPAGISPGTFMSLQNNEFFS